MITNIVLDIDNTLVCVITKLLYDVCKSSKRLKGRVFKITLRTGKVKYIVTRPKLNRFIDFCFNKFKRVSVYSAGSKLYVDLVCKVIFKEHKLDMILTKKDMDEYKQQKKDLGILFNKNKEYNIDNTIMIDDRPVIGNHILITPFEPRFKDAVQYKDNALLDIIKLLDKLET